MCRKQSGIAIGRLCDKCDGKCPVCDSYVRPTTLVRICDECSFGNYQNKCVVCGGEGISDAFYCFECTRLEKDRDGCPKIINLGSSRTDVSFLSLFMCAMFLGGGADALGSVVLSEKDESGDVLTRGGRWVGWGLGEVEVGLGDMMGMLYICSGRGKKQQRAAWLILRVGGVGGVGHHTEESGLPSGDIRYSKDMAC